MITKQRSKVADDAKLRDKVTKLFNAGYSNAVIAAEVGLNPKTLQRCRAEWGLQHPVTVGTRWRNEEDALIIRLRKEGKTGQEIAAALGRSYGAYASRLKVLKAKGLVLESRNPTGSITTAELEDAGVDHTMLSKLKSLRMGSGRIDRNFSLRDMVGMYKAQKGLCYYTQIPLEAGAGFKGKNISLDRLDSQGNYTVENTVMCCSEVNRIKGQLSIDELDWWVDKLVAGRE